MTKPLQFLLVTSLVSLLSSASTAQSEGFILTRPDCVPLADGVEQTINYMQGADPIVGPDGEINIFVNLGMLPGNLWEGIFNLAYPGVIKLGTPRFYPIWGANNFGNQKSRKENEVAFPSLFTSQAGRHLAYTSTFNPRSLDPNRDRAARLDLIDLRMQLGPARVVNRWIEPVDAACRTLGACDGNGTGDLATAVLDLHGDLFVYHPDGNLPGCESGWVRHAILDDLTNCES